MEKLWQYIQNMSKRKQSLEKPLHYTIPTHQLSLHASNIKLDRKTENKWFISNVKPV